jgi:tRNA pseudouridine38-40 synthase
MRIALALEYDGRGFCGFQSQADGCAVQDALQRALAAMAGESVTVVPAGRTDAGVHATSQVVHFDTAAQRPATAWVRGVNASLPAAMAVLWAHPVDEAFHARFAAAGRHYSYLLLQRPERPALLAGRVGWYHRPLDAAAMEAACKVILGTHDFSAFRAAQCQAKSPVKTLRVARVATQGPLVRFDFSADAFLHHMIRNLVGALLRVGAGSADAAWLQTVLEGRDRRAGAPTFAPDGLYFTGADYDAGFGLPPTRRDVVLPVPEGGA